MEGEEDSDSSLRAMVRGCHLEKDGAKEPGKDWLGKRRTRRAGSPQLARRDPQGGERTRRMKLGH